MRRKHEYLEPMCDDVQGMSVTTSKTETDYEDCNTTRMLTCSPSVLSRCTHCWVSCCASCRQWCSCRCDRPLNLYPKFLHISHRENGSFEVLSLQQTCCPLVQTGILLTTEEGKRQTPRQHARERETAPESAEHRHNRMPETL